jgi:hypothetical protein
LADFAVNNTDIFDLNVHKANVTMEGGNLTFFYGKVFIDNYKGESPISAEVRYELFCRTCNKTTYSLSFSDINMDYTDFYLNSKHSSMDQGYIPISTGYIPNKKGKSVEINTTSILLRNGISNITLRNISGSTPHADTVHTLPDTWLIHDKLNPTATNSSFKVEFIGVPGGWAGKGGVSKGNVTGSVIDVIPGNKTQMKVDW